MPVHDDYARYTPYELSLPGRDFADEQFDAIARELESRGIRTAEPAAFVMIRAAHEALEAIGGVATEAELAREHAVLLYHAFHFHRAGEPLYLLGIHAARYLVEVEADPKAAPSPPEPAGYLQLPRHLFWAQPLEGRPPEAVDGLFWCTPGEDRLSVLLVVGMRGDRPGLSVVAVPPVPLADAALWATEKTRAAGDDFAGTLPGAELDRLYSLETAGEVLKLVARTFWYLEENPRMVRAEKGMGVWTEPEGPEEPPSSEGPRPSSLRFRRIVLEQPASEEEA